MKKRGSTLSWILIVLILVVMGVITYVLITGERGEIKEPESIGDCESISQEADVNFPCTYFVPVSELPSGYEIYSTESEGYGVYEVPSNDITLGPREGVNHWYSIIYSKGDEESYGPEGIHGFSLNVLMFEQGHDKTPNIEEIELRNEQIQESGSFEVEAQYLINEDDLLVLIPFVDSTESEITEFKNKLQQMF